MVYTDKVRKKLDAILKSFGEYIDGQNYFDIVYPKKIGYRSEERRVGKECGS